MPSKIKRQAIKLISSSKIRKNINMHEVIDAMEEAFSGLSSGKSFVPQRYVTSLANGKLNLLLKPAENENINQAVVKIVVQKENGAIEKTPTIVAVVLLIDSLSGDILSIMDGEHLTALRTGAASGLATKYFANEDSEIAAVFGCGAQGKTQLEAMAAVRDFKQFWVFDKCEERAEAFVSEMKHKVKANIHITDNLDVLKECDVICTATNSNAPLFLHEHIKEGVHINAIGSYKPKMQEIDPYILKKAKIVVDEKSACLDESGDLIKPINQGLFNAEHVHGEIGEFALGKIQGRVKNNEITVFKSVGVAIQDLAVANQVYEKSIARSFGEKFQLFD